MRITSINTVQNMITLLYSYREVWNQYLHSIRQHSSGTFILGDKEVIDKNEAYYMLNNIMRVPIDKLITGDYADSDFNVHLFNSYAEEGQELLSKLGIKSRVSSKKYSNNIDAGLINEAKHYSNVKDFVSDFKYITRPASEVKIGEYIWFSPPQSTGSRGWWGKKSFRESRGKLVGWVEKMLPKSIYIKTDIANWYDGEEYFYVDKSAKASYDCSAFIGKSHDEIRSAIANIWYEANGKESSKKYSNSITDKLIGNMTYEDFADVWHWLDKRGELGGFDEEDRSLIDLVDASYDVEEELAVPESDDELYIAVVDGGEILVAGLVFGDARYIVMPLSEWEKSYEESYRKESSRKYSTGSMQDLSEIVVSSSIKETNRSSIIKFYTEDGGICEFTGGNNIMLSKVKAVFSDTEQAKIVEGILKQDKYMFKIMAASLYLQTNFNIPSRREARRRYSSVKTLYIKKGHLWDYGLTKEDLEELPNAGPNPNITGMKRLYYKDGITIKYDNYLYHAGLHTDVYRILKENRYV